jgi:hypothetical protein
MPIEILDHYGKVTTANIRPAEVELLPEAERVALFSALDAAKRCDAAEAHRDDTRKLIRTLMIEEDIAREADNKAAPQIDAIEAHRAVIAAQKPGYKSPKPAKVTEAHRAFEKIVADLANARVALITAEAEVHRLSAERGEKLVAYFGIAKRPTPDENFRAHVGKQQQHRLDVAEGRIVLPKVEPVKLSPIDAAAAARGRRPSTPLLSNVSRRRI